MINFKDGNLSEEEVKKVKAGITSGEIDKTLNLMDTGELKDLKEGIIEKTITFEKAKETVTSHDNNSSSVDDYLKTHPELFKQ